MSRGWLVVAGVVAVVLAGLLVLMFKTAPAPVAGVGVVAGSASSSATSAPTSSVVEESVAPPANPTAVEPAPVAAPAQAAAPAPSGATSAFAVAGRVLLPSGEPAAGAVVHGRLLNTDSNPPRPRNATTTTDAAGEYRLPLAATEDFVLLRADLAGYASASAVLPDATRQARQQPDKTVRADLSLGVASTISGTVVSARAGATAPVAGARVWIMRAVANLEDREAAELGGIGSLVDTITAADGTFRFAGLRAGDHWISARSPGLGWVQLDAAAPSEGLVVTLSAEDSPVVSGTVVAPDDSPVAGATVTLRPEIDNSRPPLLTLVSLLDPELSADTVVTDTEGAFAFRGWPRDLGIQLSANKGERRTFAPLSRVVGRGSEGLRLELPDEQVVSGRVIDAATGEGLPGVAIRQKSRGLPGGSESVPATTSDAEGKFTLVVGRLNFLMEQQPHAALEASKTGWLMAGDSSQQVAIPLGSSPGTREIEIQMVRAVTIAGVVRWAQPSGKPVVGSLRSIGRFNGNLGDPAIIDGAGRFAVSVVPNDTYELVANIEQYGEVRSTVIEVADESVAGIELVLQPLGSISGIVQDPEGKPLAGASISVVTQGPPGGLGIGMRNDNRGKSGDDGRFVVESIVPGQVELIASATGFAPSAATPVEVGPGQAVAVVVLVMRRGHFLAGRLIDANKQPVAGAIVTAYNAPEGFYTTAHATTDQDGRFRFDGVPATGGWDLRASLPGGFSQSWRSPEVIIDDAEKTYVVEAEPWVTIVGSVVNATTGEPVTGLRVEAQGGSPPAVVEDPNLGIFRIEKISFSWGHRYTLSADGLPDTQISQWELNLVERPVPGSVLQRTFKMSSLARVVGRVVHGDTNRPAEGMTVGLVEGFEQYGELARSSGARTAKTGTDGRFAFDDVAVGTHQLEVKTQPPLAPLTAKVHLVDGSTKDLGDLVLEKGAALTVRVVNETGAPRAGVRIEARRGARNGAAAGTIVTDANGEAAFANLARTPHVFVVVGEGLELRVTEPEAHRDALTINTGRSTLAVKVTEGQAPVSRRYNLAVERVLAPGAVAAVLGDFGPPDDKAFRTLKTVPPGQWNVEVSFYNDERRRMLAPQTATMTSGQRTELIFAMVGGAIRGRLTLADGAPAVGKIVNWEAKVGRNSVSTDDSGAFLIENLAGGVYDLNARDEKLGFASLLDIVVNPGETTGPVELAFEAAPTGSVRSVARLEGSGAPVDTAWCHLRPVGGGIRFPHAAKRDENGVMMIDNVPAGNWEADVSAWGHNQDVQRLVVVAGQTTEVTSTLYESGALRWYVNDANGKPVEDATGVVIPDASIPNMPRRTGTSTADGYIEVRGLKPGEYRLEVTKGALVGSGRITIGARQVTWETTIMK